MKKILILTAMPEELEPIIKEVNPCEMKVEHALYKVYELINSKVENKLFFSSTGIGKVNASFSTTVLLLNLKPDLVINLGTAGGINKDLKVLDLVVGNKLSYHDVDVTEFGYKLGQIPGQEQYLKINSLFGEKLLSRNSIEYKTGTILSGDSFIAQKEKSIKLSEKFEGAMAVEMESTAIVDVCHKLDTEICVIRGISDLAHAESAIEFNKYLEIVSQKFITITKSLLMEK